MVTKRDDDDRRQPGEYRAICLGKVGRQSFAILIPSGSVCEGHPEANWGLDKGPWRCSRGCYPATEAA